MAGLEISGPSTIPPGIPTQYRAILTMANGTTRDVTAEAQWRSNSVVMQVDGPGLVTGQRSWGALLTAAYSGLTSTLEVIFVPPGTFRLTGVVTDPMTPSGPVSNAEVEVRAGTGTGLWGFTGESGRFLIFGVAGDIELRVTRQGYQPRTEAFRVDQHSTRNIDLVRTAQVADVSGSYTLTIAAAETCSTALPADVMVRTYSAQLQQVGPALKITVGGATFGRINAWTPNVIDGQVFQNTLSLSFGQLGCFGYYYSCGPAVMEQLSATRFYLPTGSAKLQIGPAVLSGDLDGRIETYEGDGLPGANRTADCRSTRHRITLTR